MTTLPDETRPEMFLSGEVHGNERVGPQAVTELAAYLLENYDRERNGEQSTSWFTRMIKTRNLIIMPTANAYGYYHNTRTEHSVDPNRDFPYDSTASCMKTSAARASTRCTNIISFDLPLRFIRVWKQLHMSGDHTIISPHNTRVRTVQMIALRFESDRR